MPFINYAAREINCKVVYYGPGLAGKTTSMRYVYDQYHESASASAGKFVSPAASS